MRRFFPIAIIASSLVLFSFSPSKGEKHKFNYIAVSKLTKELESVGSFTRYQEQQQTADKGMWAYRMQTWNIIANEATVADMNRALNNN